MVELFSEPKRQKQDENVDQLSALPPSVLYHILSFLPTKTSIAMSVLSRKWCHVWENLQVFNFSDYSHEFYDHNGAHFKRFAVFVNGVLGLRQVRDILTFRLTCGHSQSDSFHANSIATWIRIAVGPKLKELDLTLFATDEHGFVVPHSLFSTCKELVSLSLCGGIHVRPQQASNVHLLSLKSLYLDIDSVDSLNTLLAGCPVLEKLHVSFAPAERLRICFPSTLKELKFAVENRIETELVIHTPGLEYLGLTHYCIGRFIYSVGNFDNIEQVYLDVNATEEPVESLIRLLTSIQKTKTLTLRRSTTRWLLRAPLQEFPNFSQMVRLEIILPWFNSTFVMNLLQKCHALQYLTIQIDKEHPPPNARPTWTEPTSVPVCIVSKLSYFNLSGYQGFPDELEFVGYIIRRSYVLKTWILKVDTMMDVQRKFRALRNLFSVPRGSQGCQATFC